MLMINTALPAAARPSVALAAGRRRALYEYCKLRQLARGECRALYEFEYLFSVY